MRQAIKGSGAQGNRGHPLVSPGDVQLSTDGRVPASVIRAEEGIGRAIELLAGRSLAERVVDVVGYDRLYADLAGHDDQKAARIVWRPKDFDGFLDCSRERFDHVLIEAAAPSGDSGLGGLKPARLSDSPLSSRVALARRAANSVPS